MNLSFKAEPIVWTTLVGAALVLLVEFGVPVTDGQQTAIQAFVAAILAFFARSQVVAPATLEKAGIESVKKVAQVANTPGAEFEVKGLASVPGSAPSDWRTPPHIPVVLLAAALMTMVGCAGRDVTTTPDQTVTQIATYGERVLELTRSVQQTVNTYASTTGGRTAQTDALSAAIRDRVIPAAESLDRHLKGYTALRLKGAVPNTADVDVLRGVLESYEEVVEEVLMKGVPDDVAPKVATTVSEISKLILNIRDLINQVRQQTMTAGLLSHPQFA